MPALTFVTGTNLRHRHVDASENINFQLHWKLRLIAFGGVLSLALSAALLGVIAIARIQPTPKIMNVPSVYLPGNPKPGDVSCELYTDEHQPRCFVTNLNHDLYFNFDPIDGTVTGTIIPGQR